MSTTFAAVHQSPDDLMTIPVADLVYKLDRRVRRAARWRRLADDETNTRGLKLIRHYMNREEALIHAAATALRTRAGEASRFAASVGVRCPRFYVRVMPHLAACALVKHIMGPEYERDE